MGLKSKTIENEDIGDSYFGGMVKFKTKVVWPNAIGFLLIHIAGVYGMWLAFYQMWHLQFLSTLYMYLLIWIGAEGVTIGAHRLWSHKAFKARRPLRILLVLMQTLSGQNCAYIWIRDHRLHHKYADTDADPHNSKRGFFFSHMGWLMMKKHPEVLSKGKGIDLSDIKNDPVVMFQKRHFKKLYYTFGVVIPTILPVYLWDETLWNSIFICYFFRYIFLLHVTWSVNSFAHLFGCKPYDKNIIAAENPLVSFMSYGEGWHNYHHIFPWDYKASEFGMKWNLTRGIIEFFERIRLAYDLKEAKPEMVYKRIIRSGDGSHKNVSTNHIESFKAGFYSEASKEQQSRGW